LKQYLKIEEEFKEFKEEKVRLSHAFIPEDFVQKR